MNKNTTKTKKTQQAAGKAAKKPIEGENIDYAVTTAKLSDLIPDDKNFNKGTEFGQHLIEKSLRENGAGRSILLDKNNRIIAGNKTTENAANIDMEDVIIVETDGTKLVAVKRTDIDLDSEQGRQMALADNATSAANLDWDEDALKAMEQEMDNFSAEEWGVEIETKEEENQAVEDNFDEEKDHIEVRCKRGDTWQLGEHRLMCGDSINLEEVKRLMGGGKTNLLLTDPPYNVDVENSQGMKIANDKMPDASFLEFLTKAFKAAQSVMSDGCPFYVWFASKYHIAFETALKQNRLNVKQELIWNKNHFILGRQHYQWKHEPCLYGWKGDSCRYFTQYRNKASVIEDAKEVNIEKLKKDELKDLLRRIYEQKPPQTVIDCNKPAINDEHPTMKPVRLIGHLMSNSSKQGDIILDLFGGSGTTLIAAEQLNRKCYMMELDPHYCDVIIARWEKLTNGKAKKIDLT